MQFLYSHVTRFLPPPLQTPQGQLGQPKKLLQARPPGSLSQGRAAPQ